MTWPSPPGTAITEGPLSAELASQVQDVLRPLAKTVGLRVATIFGGTSQRPQVTALHNRVDVIVACPGRLADLIDQGHCHLGDVEISVVDEADHMADLGFLPAVRRLLDSTPPDGQRMLFSATLDHAVGAGRGGRELLNLTGQLRGERSLGDGCAGRGRPGHRSAGIALSCWIRSAPSLSSGVPFPGTNR